MVMVPRTGRLLPRWGLVALLVGSLLRVAAEAETVVPTEGAQIKPRAEAWLGVALSMKGAIRRDDSSGATAYVFTEPPEIHAVEPNSPADRAGLLRGDRILQVNGVAIDTAAGGQTFSRIGPGEATTWTIARGDETRTVRIVSEARPVWAARPEVERSQPGTGVRTTRALRFAGSLGGMDIEVRGPDTVQVLADSDAGEILITIGEVTVRLVRAR